MALELRIFHASGYDSRNVDEADALTSAELARFDFAKVRSMVLINWSVVDAEGRAEFVWRWEL